MPFDEESAPWDSSEPLQSEPRGFSHDQMVRCEACLRANPPTRTSCLYCGAQLPATEAGGALQRPTLRRLEKWEQGFNVILPPTDAALFSSEALRKAAELLRIRPEDLGRIIEAGEPLPVARAATSDEAALVERKLRELGFESSVISDGELGAEASFMKRARAFELTEDALVIYPAGGGEFVRVLWTEVSLLLAGRLLVREVAVEERKGRRAEKEIVDARELSADEAVLDIYTTRDKDCWRVSASNFDFSCLGARKGFVGAQNLATLVSTLRERAGEAVYEDSYMRVRGALAHAWPVEQQTEARGWRRSAPGRVTTEEVARSDNESQFTRYSRLRRYLQLNAGPNS
ncbi:MAG TPA: hypothetical protein VJ715_00025 [Pyrinomonadaceae bacterium]|nr:hypothetical protein [Pyrinomonadaceae bacterium]